VRSIRTPGADCDAGTQERRGASGTQHTVKTSASGAAVQEADALKVKVASPPVLPSSSDGESPAAWGDAPDTNDARLRSDVPPHW